MVSWLQGLYKIFIMCYYIYGDMMEDKLKKIIEVLSSKNKTLSTMESCTGGALINKFTDIPGSSEVIKFGAVTYNNDFKVKMGVPKSLIDTYSVYSIETARSMAKTIKTFTFSDYSVGITGKLNKPDPFNKTGRDNEVFVSIYEGDKYYDLDVFVLHQNRADNKNEVIDKILDKLLEIIQ